MTIGITFDDFQEDIEVEELGSGRFRLLQTPLLADLDVGLGDEVLLEPLEDGLFAFRSVASRCGWVREHLVVGPCSAEKRAELMGLADSFGAKLEPTFEGVLVVSVPPSQARRFLALFHRALDAR